MKSKINRRNFFIRVSQAGVAGCALMFGLKLSAMDGFSKFIDDDEIPDPKKLEYCGYQCPEKCLWRQGTLENNVELKKEAYEQWKIKERFDMEFDPDTMFCYSCKAKDKPEGFILKQCTVRNCCMEKGLDCCIECNELSSCEKDLWTRYPKFKEAVIEMQKKYFKR